MKSGWTLARVGESVRCRHGSSMSEDDVVPRLRLECIRMKKEIELLQDKVDFLLHHMADSIDDTHDDDVESERRWAAYRGISVAQLRTQRSHIESNRNHKAYKLRLWILGSPPPPPSPLHIGPPPSLPVPTADLPPLPSRPRALQISVEALP
jgi:hypothetical protein